MHRKDNIQDYADPSGHSQAWHGNPVYPQNHPQHPLPSSYPHPHVTPMDHQWVPPEYMARLAPQQGPYPYSIAHEESTQAHLTYSPASSSGPQTPAFQGAPSTAFSVLAQLPSRGSPSPMPLPIDETLPSNVRSALQAAYKTNEWAQGENVPAEVIMPTVQKLSNDSWVCLICQKAHKRRDHTLTHVRTAHLQNKGWRCKYPDCDSAFGRKGDLERHEQSTHQKKYDQSCPHCKTQLHRKDNLARHMRSCKLAGTDARHQYASQDVGSSSGARPSSPTRNRVMSPSGTFYSTTSSRSRRRDSSATQQIYPQPPAPQVSSTTLPYLPNVCYAPTGFGLGLMDMGGLTSHPRFSPPAFYVPTYNDVSIAMTHGWS